MVERPFGEMVTSTFLPVDSGWVFDIGSSLMFFSLLAVKLGCFGKLFRNFQVLRRHHKVDRRGNIDTKVKNHGQERKGDKKAA